MHSFRARRDLLISAPSIRVWRFAELWGIYIRMIMKSWEYRWKIVENINYQDDCDVDHDVHNGGCACAWQFADDDLQMKIRFDQWKWWRQQWWCQLYLVSAPRSLPARSISENFPNNGFLPLFSRRMICNNWVLFQGRFGRINFKRIHVISAQKGK